MKVSCPYCNKENKLETENFNNYDQGESIERECRNCGKIFLFSYELSFEFSAQKADCLNGAEHKFERTNAYPEAFRKIACKVCGLEQHDPDREQRIKEYFDELNNRKAGL